MKLTKLDILFFIVMALFIGFISRLQQSEVRAADTSGERFEILNYQKVGFLQVRVVCDKETELVYTWSYAVDNGGNVGGVSIEPLVGRGGSTLYHFGCGK